MTKRNTLFLVRHGKAAEPWDYDTDFERPLTRKGKMAVAALAETLQLEGLIPELMLSSPAFRTAQTSRLLAETLGLNPNEIRYEANLYPGSLPLYRDAILKWRPQARSIMLVGHNPNLEELIAHLSSNQIVGLPTSGCAVFDFADGLMPKDCNLRFHHLK